MNRANTLIIGLVAAVALVLAPAMALAQTNIDQGKSASQIFSNACAECHKSAGGLGKGKNASTVAEFLREHYTTSPEQAASLAAYVVGGRDSVASPIPGRKPPAAVSASTEAGKPDPRRGPRPPADVKPREESAPSLPSFMNPIVRPEPTPPRDNKSAARNRRREPVTTEPPASEPAAAAHTPAPVATPEPARSEPPPVETREPEPAPAPTAAAPSEAPAGDSGEPVPRDHIPD